LSREYERPEQVPVELKVPHITREQAEQFAEGFLETHHPSRSLPVPIDLLAEKAGNLDIVPCTGVDDVVDGHGFLSSDLNTIYIDWHVYHHKVPHRYRSTVAHELGHLVMHAAVYRGLHIESLDEHLEFIRAIDADALSWLETHADWFMGFVLVPRAQLRRLLDEKLAALAAAGYQPAALNPAVADRVARSLAQDFCVSPRMIKTRLRQDKLLDPALLD